MPHVFAPELIPQKYFYALAPGMCEYRHYINTEGRGQSANTYFEKNSSKIVSCIRTHVNTGPTCIRAKINSSRNFSCMYRFCAGGYVIFLKMNSPMIFWVHVLIFCTNCLCLQVENKSSGAALCNWQGWCCTVSATPQSLLR